MPRWSRKPGVEDALQQAIVAWKAGLYKSRKDCAKSHGVDPKTFRNRVSGKTQSYQASHISQLRISVEGERTIVRHCIYLAKAGFLCRYRVIRSLADAILQRESGPLPLHTSLDPLGTRWVYRFLYRQDELRVCYVRSLELERALANNNPARIERFFQEYTAIKKRYNIANENVWNMDETGFSMGLAYSARVVVFQDYHKGSFKTVDGSREWVTSIDTIASNGRSTPPFLIFKGKQHTQALWDEAKVSLGTCAICLTENSWSNTEIGFQWLQHSEQYSKSVSDNQNQVLALANKEQEEEE
jgi:hypothetical protein